MFEKIIKVYNAKVFIESVPMHSLEMSLILNPRTAALKKSTEHVLVGEHEFL